MLSHRLTTIAAIGIGTAAIGLAAAGTAAASSADDAFLSQMTAVGISFSSPQEAVRAGHQVCKELAAGKTEADIAVEIRSQTQLSPKQVAYFVVDASNIYCPRLASELT
ncbi:hypothetical protein MRAB57_3405 [Mycobacterium rhizamassiliense]|uniref:DUF732 domain-containing protein n=1 Tax=Mycobacterium rhizamassiliense TaxID=1841860 RepID=A0A2U3NVP3_9MYCO|nr:DUF732 domain-containing protein [Mycobacterium rhizamassiliense]SPM35580.1 hypothetical protein MRAB57_3405 [Mycobacterium rhizamassiliense]